MNYKRRVFGLGLLLFIPSLLIACGGGGQDGSSNGSGDKSNQDENKEKVDLVLFVGEDNMLGKQEKGSGDYNIDIPAGQAFEFKKANNALVALGHDNGEDLQVAKKSSGYSLVPKFVEEYIKKTSRKVIAVHVAGEDLKISDFAPNTQMYGDIADKLDACLETIDPNYAVENSFYVMLQGESDNAIASEAEYSIDTYKSSFNKFHKALMRGYDFDFGALICTGAEAGKELLGVARVNQAKYAISKDASDVILASNCSYKYFLGTENVIAGDEDYHYNTNGLKAVATEAATNIANYLGASETLKKVDPATYMAVPNKPTNLNIGEALDLEAGQSVDIEFSYEVNQGLFGVAENDVNELLCNSFVLSSSSNNIINIVGNTITAVGSGEATITATYYADSSVAATRAANVVANDEQHTMSANLLINFEGGAVSDYTKKREISFVGAGNPTIAEGYYNYTGSDVGTYHLSKELTISTEGGHKEFRIEWKGKLDEKADSCVLVSGPEFKIEVNKTDGFVVTYGTTRISYNDVAITKGKTFDPASVLEENTWSFRSRPHSTNPEQYGYYFALYRGNSFVVNDKMNGTFTITDILGDGVAPIFNGSIDYISITDADD